MPFLQPRNWITSCYQRQIRDFGLFSFYKMILFIRQNSEGSVLFIDNYIQKASKPSISIIKLLCEKALCSYESRVTSTKSMFKLYARVPIHIHQELLLFPTKSPRTYENIWVNYCSIFTYEKRGNQVLVFFKNNVSELIDITYKQFKQNMSVCQKIFNYTKHLEDSLYF